MKRIFFLALSTISLITYSQSITTRFEQSGGKQSPPYAEIIDWWTKLDKLSPIVKLFKMGESDAGFPLHLVVLSGDQDFNFESLRKKNKRILLFNNGIHPGEPDGIDASMLLARDIVTHKAKLPDNVVVAIIPVYNIGGCLNRNPNYRIDQSGPDEKGFRGNSENLDLNRDFIKCDSKEARSFASIFHLVDPDVFVDNHVSDGADYQHVMTLICSQHNKLGGPMGEFMNQQFEPGLYTLMKGKGYDLVPYVNEFGDSVETGWPAFMDGPRYSSGYATLWQCFGFIPETHMLKPYDQRVKSTYALMQSFIEFTSTHSDRIKQLRAMAKESVKTQTDFPLNWVMDKSRSASIDFKGFASAHKPSAVSGLPRLYYDRSKPYEKKVPFFNYYNPGTVVKKPTAYIIPQGWWKVISLLQVNKVRMSPLRSDTLIEVEVYHIDEYKSSNRQYELHHPNNSVKLSSSLQKLRFRKGDYWIPLDQVANRFLIETLEPQAEDSYFTWNYFDAVLGQKEGFSDYSFEDIAANYLKEHPEVRSQLDARKASDSTFAKSAFRQLNFVYEHSPYFEPDYLRYPVYRVQ